MVADNGSELKHVYSNQKLKHLSENYDAHIEDILPDYLHRGDISTVNRLLGYTDAMMATCATFLVLPFRNLKEMHTGQALSSYMFEKRTELVMFFIGFLIICTIWESINVRSIVIKRLDDCLVLFSILLMFATTVLPFSLALQGNYPKEDVAIVITTVVLLVIEVLELFIIFYAFASPRLIHYALKDWPSEYLKRFRFMMCIKPVFNFFLVGIAGLFCLLDYRVSWVLFSLLILTPLIRKLIMYIRRRFVGVSKREKCEFFFFFTKGNINKERVECFTDAATAIIACVLILDITVEEFPKKEVVHHEGLVYVLNHMKLEFVIFFGTYIMVSLLWYVNHTILHLFHTINVVILYLQKIFLVFLCLTPLFSNMLVKFSNSNDHNTQVAVRYASLITLASSICNFFMVVWGFHKSEKVFHKWAAKKCIKSNAKQHMYVLLKSLNIPFWSVVAFFGSFADGRAAKIVLLTVFLAMIVTFIVLKFTFLNHIGKTGLAQFDDTTVENKVDNLKYERESKDSSVEDLREEMKESKFHEINDSHNTSKL